MRIAFITYYDRHRILGRNPKIGKGAFGYYMSGHFMAEALEGEGAQLFYIGPLVRRNFLFSAIKQIVCVYLMGKRHMWEFEPDALQSFAQKVEMEIREIKPDIIISHGAFPVARLRTPHPVVVWTDAPFACLLNYYPRFRNLCSQSVKNGLAAEREALERSSLIIYSSTWALQGAVKTHGVNPSKIKVITPGANLVTSKTLQEVQGLVRNRSKQICKLLFIGVDWERKGGNEAIGIAQALNERGIKTELTIVGTRLGKDINQPTFVNVLGFISRTAPEGKKIFEDLLSESHFLILPSVADCTPAVIREACAFGLPCLSSDTGGINSLIRNGVNGQVFALPTNMNEYASYISSLWADPYRYQSLCHSTFIEFQTRLNWTRAAKEMMSLFRKIT